MLRKLMLVLLPLTIAAFAADNVWTVSDPSAPRIPADPDAPLIVEVPVTPETDQPPFGTVVQQWNLTMSGTYAGAGMTWRRDQGRFYMIDQGYAGTKRMWSLDPADPVGTIRDENWTFPNIGSPTVDIPWGVAWDDDSSCFWISNITDGNIYGGCNLLRMTPAGTWTGDSWLVADGNLGGPIGAYWTAGMEKWIDRGFFALTPVASGIQNNTAFFNPYTKSYLGRTANGPTVSERGCALVPYDSLYILTNGWNENNWRKRDTTGFLLQQVAATVYGPADWAMWVPVNINPTDTVYVFNICSNSNNTFQKISLGMTWGQLPSVNPFSVGPVAILAPVGAIDSAVVTTPRLVIRNKSNETVADSVHVTFTIHDGLDAVIYSDEAYILAMQPSSFETLAFTPWTPTGRDSLSVKAWTYWASDSVPQDDTIRNRFMVRMRNVGLTEILDPPSPADSGVYYRPRARVYNYGTQSETFNLNFRIGAFNHNVLVTDLLPNYSRVVTAADSWQALPGYWVHTVSALLAGDLHPEDNVMVDTIYVPGVVGKDVAVEEILAPPSFVDTLTTVTPQARIANYGGGSETFRAWFTVWDTATDVRVYRDSLQLSLPGGGNTVAAFTPVRFTMFGPHVAQCSVYLVGDQNALNDKLNKNFTVSSAQRDVALEAIIAPAGAVDSGASITPRAVVRNGGLMTENFPAYFQLPGGYLAVANVVDLAPGEADTINFSPAWPANFRDSLTARAWTLLPPDEVPENDTLEQRFFVQVGDVGVEQVIYPVDTIPEGTWMTPQARVRNYGTKPETFEVDFRIGLFLSTMLVEDLAPGAAVDLTFPDSLEAIPGIWLDRVEARLAGDINPGNNVAYDTFVVPGLIEHDVGVVAVFEPAANGSYDT
ncbi:MAG: hypothetical protein R6X14_02840, partial [bacterium]